MIPDNFNDWVNCITKKCKINLDSSYARKRIEVLEDDQNEETKRFLELYGQEHLDNVIHWFKQIL